MFRPNLQPIVPAMLCGAFVLAAGCAGESRMVGKAIRHHVVGTVVDQGMTLGPDAGAKEVVYVLLSAIRDDFDAGDDVAAREAAFDRTLAMSAPDYMFRRAFRKSLGRDESVQKIVWRWAPVLGHYTADFPADWAAARERMIVARAATEGGASDPDERSRVFIELASPDGDPNASVVAQFLLVRERGCLRVAMVGYEKRIRQLTSRGLVALGYKSVSDSSS